MKLVSSTYVTPSLIAKHIIEQLEKHVFSGAMVFASADIEYENLLPLLNLNCPYIGTTVLTAQHGVDNSFSTCVVVIFGDEHEPVVGEMRDIAKCSNGTTFAFSTSDPEIAKHCKSSAFSGGLAADNWAFERMAVFMNGAIIESGTVGLHIKSPNETTFECGWETIPGTRARVTRSSGGRVQMIDNEKAVDWYKRFIPSAGAFGAYPIRKIDTKEFRAPLSVNEDDGSIGFSAEIMEGETIELTTTQREKIMDASKRAIENNTSNQCTGILFSCAARSLVLGDWADKEHELLKSASPLTIYLYGEFTPGNGTTTLQNQHVVLTSIKDKNHA